MSRSRLSLTAVGLVATAVVTFPQAVRAHGAPEHPVSRQYNCFQDRTSAACRAAIAYGGEQAIYDWNGVNQAAAGGNHRAVVADGKLCAGGKELFKGFDLARPDWPATAWSPGADGRYEFRYHATAPHATANWQFFLTRQGYDGATAALKWSDLDLVAQVPASQVVATADKRYVMRLALPARTGRHVLYAAWQRSDSTEAFYACSDVTFGGGPVPPVPSTLQQLGPLAATQDLPAGASVRLRVFGAAGADLESHTVTIAGAAAGARAAWLTQLAAQANAQSAYVRVGVLQNGAVAVPAGSTTLQVYALTATSGVSYALDTTLPPTVPPAAGTWVEGATYRPGDVVTHKGVRYVCLQGHTAYVGAGWAPDTPTVIDVLWKKQ